MNRKLSILSLGVLSVFSVSAFGADFTAKIDTSKRYQKIESFAASDAWSGNFVGKFFDESKKGQIAKWLFSQKFGEDGSPEGIGLSLWRVNIGGGTWEQEGADIEPIQRRAESFLAKDGKSYDWTKAAGQQYFMRKAREYGCKDFLLFSNTPPVQWTKNGKGYTGNSLYISNLREDCYDDFAEYMADVAKHFIDEGYNIRYISPVNEPGWKWEINSQEGSAWTNPEIAKLARELDKSLLKRGIADTTKQLLCEAAILTFLYEKDKQTKNPNPIELFPHEHIQNFFDEKSPNYIGNLKSIPKKIGAHDYATHDDNKMIVEKRAELKQWLDKYGLDYIQTEWCFFPWLKTPMDGIPRAKYTNMDVALLMTRLIHTDLTLVNSPSWSYWKGMEVEGSVALTAVYLRNGDICQGGEVASTRLLWSLGNYSFFLRPNWQRVDLQGVNDLNSVYASAFISPDGKKMAIVVGNISFEENTLSLSFAESQAKDFAKVSRYQTSESANLTKLGPTENFKNESTFRLAPRSMTTFYLESE